MVKILSLCVGLLFVATLYINAHNHDTRMNTTQSDSQQAQNPNETTKLPLNKEYSHQKQNQTTQTDTTQKPHKKQDIFSFPTTHVSKQTIADSRRYYGTLKEDESKIYSLSVRADGFIENLFVTQTYAQVKAREALFSFYSPEIIDAQSEFLATLPYSHLAQQKLLLLGVDSQEIAKLRNTRRIMNAITFYAPFDSLVFIKNVNKGSGVKKGEEIFQLINISTLWVIANINQEDLAFIRQNNNIAHAIIEGYQGKIEITFDKVYPNVVDNFIQARFILRNPDLKFFPNAFVQVYIESPPKERLVLPQNAVLFKNGKHFVFINDEGDFIPQEIEAKRILGTKFYEIIDGLEENQSVIKDALFVVDSDAQNNGWFE
ncbi:HlyD family efflux transporter periplasmic adaptor subunit [Helicobacter sp. MIT 14-3879]|uniref:HlyD family efflux transporter periplasmic adaptor subunit n=1 Tax=Helicobacter sp. MIT 14-3879 TaxID=2040649 RepID=UPI000E1E71B8|nr:HlyD family efflux transporter periplasmic adaptor subunit [Helicobacter sp. MIT 14-3879]RDU59197.1 hemolysin D [Helicobacter sp. MIT 14-3879]